MIFGVSQSTYYSLKIWLINVSAVSNCRDKSGYHVLLAMTPVIESCPLVSSTHDYP